MINYLRHMAIFAKVVDKGAFRSAAKELELAPSRVSETISDLEAFLGVTLFYRTTRKLSLTSEGRQLYTHVASMLKNAEAGLDELSTLSKKPVGSLKITIPAFLEASTISLAIASFIKQYPEVNISLIYTDHVINMLDEEVDLRIRAGAQGISDSSMISRKLGEIRRLLVASKEYYDTQAPPQHPTDLKNWDWVHFQMRSNIIEFTSSSNEVVKTSEKSRLSVNSANALKYLINQHVGISILPENLIRDEIQAGKLIHILPEWQVKPLECYAIWPDKSRRESLTTFFVRYLAKYTMHT